VLGSYCRDDVLGLTGLREIGGYGGRGRRARCERGGCHRLEFRLGREAILFIAFVVSPRAHDDVHALGGEPQGRCPPHALSRTQHQRDFGLQCQVHFDTPYPRGRPSQRCAMILR
jgi:hypothetical protein